MDASNIPKYTCNNRHTGNTNSCYIIALFFPKDKTSCINGMWRLKKREWLEKEGTVLLIKRHTKYLFGVTGILYILILVATEVYIC